MVDARTARSQRDTAEPHRGYEETVAPNLYFDRHFNMQAAKILPGEYYATTRNMLIVTVLGSCVSACIRDRELGIGGMNHFMLPHSDDAASLLSNATRYGTYAMEMLINHLLKLGARRPYLEAKLFGGGAVMKEFTTSNVGTKNADFALQYLETEKIKVVAKDLLDVYPRKVYFFPKEDRVLVKKLRNLHNHTVIDREQEYGSRIGVAKVEGDIELFT
jgi:chemotaxis protein CheD